jgi:hypothetical protein
MSGRAKVSALRKVITKIQRRGYGVTVERSRKPGVRHFFATKTIGSQSIQIQLRGAKGKVLKLGGGHSGASLYKSRGGYRALNLTQLRDKKGRFARR